LDLFLGLFSGFGRNLVWQDDNIVKFVQICHNFITFPAGLLSSFRQNQFSEVLFTLKSSGYLNLARKLMSFASRQYDNIFVFQYLVAATSVASFQRAVERRFSELDEN